MIVHGGAPGIDHSFSLACEELGVTDELCLPEFSRVGDHSFQNGEMLRRGADLCLILHRAAVDEPNNDLARQAIAAGTPVWLIADQQGVPKRLGG